MNDEVLVDDVELNQGDAYDGENECQHHHVVYAANGIAISMPPYWDDFSFSIETTKYNAWWEYRENVFRAFRKNGDDRIDLFSIPLKDKDFFDAFCQCDMRENGRKEIVHSTEADFDKFVERYLNLRVFI